MRTARLYYPLIVLLLLLCLPLSAQPKLQLVAVVDGMRTEDMARLMPYFNKGGLRTIGDEGMFVPVRMEEEVYGGAETAVSLLSGASPAENGVAMDYYMSPENGELHYALEDKSEAGIISSLKLSARPILSPLLADYFRFDFGRQTRVFSVGIDPQTAIALAGHAANGCCWFDSHTLQWATTTFYKEGLPLVADEVNSSGSIARTMEKEWKPRLNINIYNNPTEQELNEGFLYSPVVHPVSTPAVNTLVVNLALEIQQSYKLGKSSVPDMLLLEFTVLPPLADGDYIESAAAEDMYLCLNQDLGFLLEQLERRLGAGQVQLTLLGLPRYGISPSSLSQMGMPLKQFSTERAAALAAAYLMALYGYEKWVFGGYGNTIYFNRPLIEKLKMPLTQMQQQVADLLVDFEAVQMAYPVREMCQDPVLCRSLAKKWTGDVVFKLQNGWQLAYNEQMPIDRVWEKQPEVPLYIWGGKHHKRQDGGIPDAISGTDVLNIIRQSWK